MAYGFRRQETVQSSQVGGTLADFPALLSRTHNDFRSVGNGGHVQNGNGYDLNLFADSAGAPGSMLDMETESYNAATGAVVKWARVPSIANGTVVWWQYGDSGISSSQDNPTAVWPSAMKAVYHLGDGSTLSLADSTSNGYTLTNTNGVTAAAGTVGAGAASFNAGSSQFLTNASPTYTGTGQSVTFQFWAKVNNDGNANGTVSIDDEADPGNRIGAHVLWSDDNVYWDLGDLANGGRVSVGAGAYRGAWAKYDLIFDAVAPAHEVRINGASAVSNASSSSPATPFSRLNIGTYDGSNTFYSGLIDEFRLWLGGVPSADWSTAEYNNQSAPTSFWGLGSEQSIGGGPTTYNQNLDGALTPAAALVKRTQRRVSGGVTTAGAIAKRCGKRLSAAVGTAGVIVKRAGKRLAGTATMAGSIGRRCARTLAAAVVTAGSVHKRPARSLTAALTAAGVLTKRARKVLAGTLTTATALAGVRLSIAFTKSLTATLSMAGAVTKRTKRTLVGTLTTAGSLTRRGRKALAGTVAIAGVVHKRTARSLAAVLSTSSALSVVRVIQKALAATLAIAAVVRKQTGKRVAGTVGIAGVVRKRTTALFASTLAATATVRKRTARHLAGSLTAAGAVAAARVFVKALTATLTAAGTVTKRTAILFVSALTMVGVVRRVVGRRLTAILAPTGVVRKRTSRVLAGVVSFSTTVAGIFAFLFPFGKSYRGTATYTPVQRSATYLGTRSATYSSE